jgi:hypothetical protein
MDILYGRSLTGSATGYPGNDAPMRRMLALVLLVMLSAAACSGADERDGRRDGRRTEQPPVETGTGEPSPPVSPTAQPPTGETLPLGTFTPAQAASCARTADECQGFQVSCPDVSQPDDGILHIGHSAGAARGLVMLFSGGKGTGPWGETKPGTASAEMLEGLQAQGLTTIQVEWGTSWMYAAPGEAVGPALLACRGATVVQWVHENMYQGMGVSPAGVGQCGFCISGDSGGASQVGYVLSHYGLADIVDVAIMGGGPPHAAIDDGCLAEGRGDRLRYTESFSLPLIDASYGAFDGNGPCARSDPAWAEQWEADSIDGGGSQYRYPNTRVVFLWGEDDGSGGPPHGEFLYERLRDEGTPHLIAEVVPGMGHLSANSVAGVNTVGTMLLASA